MAPGLSPSTGAISPQDLVSGAVQSALNAKPAAPAAASQEDVVQAAAPAPKPRKPMQSDDSELTPAVAPAPAPELSSFGNGSGGPAFYNPGKR
jgi:hypothetical protein